jgi:hypothetical protein
MTLSLAIGIRVRWPLVVVIAPLAGRRARSPSDATSHSDD